MYVIVRHKSAGRSGLVADCLTDVAIWHMANLVAPSCAICKKTTVPKERVLFWPITDKNRRCHVFFCKFINSFAYEYVCKKPCFAKLSQASDKLDAVMSIVSQLRRSGAVTNHPDVPSRAVSDAIVTTVSAREPCVGSSTPTSFFSRKRTSVGQQQNH